jgi:hypothetical protein
LARRSKVETLTATQERVYRLLVGKRAIVVCRRSYFVTSVLHPLCYVLIRILATHSLGNKLAFVWPDAVMLFWSMPLALTALSLTFWPRYSRYHQTISVLLILGSLAVPHACINWGFSAYQRFFFHGNITMMVLVIFSSFQLRLRNAMVLSAIYLVTSTGSAALAPGADKMFLATGVQFGGMAYALGMMINQLIDQMRRRDFLLGRLLRAEKQRSEMLLLNILPKAISLRLKKSPNAIADEYPEVTVLFADLTGFTRSPPPSLRLR